MPLLQVALSKATHLPYATLLAQRTTAPLGMHETGYTPNAGECSRLLRGGHEEGPCTDTQNSAGSSGLYSTSTDMTTWLKYLLSLGTITHTSGLPREVAAAPRDTPHFTFPDYNYRWHWLGMRDPKHLKSVPGIEALYSNLGYDFLGDALHAPPFSRPFFAFRPFGDPMAIAIAEVRLERASSEPMHLLNLSSRYEAS